MVNLGWEISQFPQTPSFTQFFEKLLNIYIIFDSCQRRLAAENRDKYERDSKKTTYNFTKSFVWEN